MILDYGYIGIFLGMVLESSFIPFPSEAILLPAGLLAAQGQLSFTLIFILSLLGSLAGALINFALALFMGRSFVDNFLLKHSKILLINKSKLKKLDKYFDENGEITTFVGRLIPVFRQLISLPAGFARMNLFKFIIYTSLGAGLWSLILISLGYFLGSQLEFIQANITILSISIGLVAVIGFLIYFIYKNYSSSDSR